MPEPDTSRHRTTEVLSAPHLARLPDLAFDWRSAAALGASGLPQPLVISLARRPDRWVRARDNLGRIDIATPLKVDAVDGQSLRDDVLSVFLDDAAGIDEPLEEYLRPTRPAVGCFLSHLAIWRSFLRSGAPHVLVLEDDALPAPEYAAARARRILSEMPTDADMMLLGYTIMDGLAAETTKPRLRRIYYYNGTYAYVLTRKGCQNLLPRLSRIRTHIDNQISLELVADQELRVYGVEPRLFTHDFSVWSDVYVPVLDTAIADRRLAAVFDDARLQLTAQGIQLLPRHQPSGI